MNELAFLVTLAILVEGVVNVFASLYVHDTTLPWYGRIQWKLLASIGVSVLVAFTTKADVFTAIGIPLTPQPIAFAMTGFLISRGSNYAYELIAALQANRKANVAKTKLDLPVG